MQSMETLQKLIDAEKEAARLTGEAEAFVAAQEARVRAGKDDLLLRYKDRTDAALQSAERAERARADAAIAELTENTGARLASLRSRFASDRERYAGELLELALGNGDEK